MSRLLKTAVLCVLVLGCTIPALFAQEVKLRVRSAIYLDPMGSGIRIPEGVAFDGSSTLVVADSGNGRLVVYTVGEEGAMPTAEIRLAEVPYPTRTRFDSENRLLVLDGKSRRIARLSTDGDFVGFVEIPTQDRQEIVLIKSFDIDREDNLHILDVAGGRILVLDSTDSLIREIDFDPEAGFLADIAVSSNGAVFAIDSLNQRVLVARSGDEALSALSENLSEDMALPTAIAADETGNLFIADGSGHGIVIIGQNGEFRGRQSAMGWKEGFLRHPSDLFVGNGDLYVADRSNNRVQRFAISE